MPYIEFPIKIPKILRLAILSLTFLFIFIRIASRKQNESDSLSIFNLRENSTTGENTRANLSSKKIIVYKGFEFEANKFWRPDKVNTEGFFDFDASIDDRILQQRSWMKNLSQSSIFKDLKPKRILIENDFPAINNGILYCADGDTQVWAQKCILEIDKKFNTTKYPKNIEGYDAIIEFRNGYYKKERKLSKGSKVKQILFTFESPFITGSYDLSLNNAFLASYWRGADIPVPYFKWFPFKRLKRDNNESKIRNYAQGKTKLAAIVVSNSKPTNSRLEYVKELQRHMPVDIYGKCGNLNCTEPCYKNLKKDYKFYLAFENANCRDYITEKLFRNSLENDMVPVVMGAEKKDYLSAAPPHSFIHVEDFESPLELAHFLKHLDQNDDLYNKYFAWKSKGYLHTWLNTDFFCRACGLLFMTDFVRAPVWPKGSSWQTVNKCVPRGRWYWHRPNK